MKLKSKNIWELSQTFAGLDYKKEGLFLPNKIINYRTQESQIISQTDFQAAVTNKRISILDKNLVLNSVFHHTWNVIKTSIRHVVSAVQHRELKLVLGLSRPPTVRPRSLIEGFSPDVWLYSGRLPSGSSATGAPSSVWKRLCVVPYLFIYLFQFNDITYNYKEKEMKTVCHKDDPQKSPRPHTRQIS